MRFLPSLGRAPQVKAAVDRRHSDSTYYTAPGVPMPPPLGSLDVERAVSDAYERVVWVYRAIDARAGNASRLTVNIKDGRGDKAKVIEDHPVARVLNRRANPYEVSSVFRYRLHTLLDLSRKGVFVEAIEDRSGRLRHLHLLNPAHVFPIPDPDTFVSKFLMRLSTGETFPLDPYKRGKGGVLWIRRPHPLDPYSSMTWVEAAGISIDLDYYARIYNRNFLANDGRPGGILAVDGEIDPAEAAILAARMSGGPDAAGKVTVIEGDHLNYHDLTISNRDAQYVESRALSKSEILVAAGTPLSVIGDASGRTFDNADAEEENFWRHTMLPELDLLGSFFEELTEGGVEDDTEVVDFDVSEVAVLQRDKRAREAQAAADLEKGVISIDEYREIRGWDPLDLPGTRVLWTPAGRAPIGTDEDVVALLTQGQQASPPPEAPPGPDGQQPALPPGPDGGLDGGDPGAVGPDGQPLEPGTEPGAVPDVLDEANYATKAAKPDATDPFARIRRAHDDLVGRWESAVEDEILALLRRQEQVVLARLTGAKARRHTRHWDGDVPAGREVKALDAAYILDRARWVREVVNAITDVIRAAFGMAGAAVVARLGGTGFDAGEQGREVIARVVRSIAEYLDERAGRLQQVIDEGEQAGKTIDEIAADVREAYGDAATWASATSRDVVGAMNAASLIGATQSGAVNKRWLATDDERTRPTHRHAEGQVVPVGQPFRVGEAELMYPHDVSGGAATIGEWINCRCTMLFQLGQAPDDEASLDADLAELAAIEAEWKALGRLGRVGRVAAAAVGGFLPAFDPDAHPRDSRGRFIDSPTVSLPDGSTGRALAVDRAGRVVVARDDGTTVTEAASQVHAVETPDKPGQPDTHPMAATPPDGAAATTTVDDLGEPGGAATGQKGDAAKARAEIPTVAELIDKGMTPDDAAKEWKRLYHNARFRYRRARLKAEKDAAKAKQDDLNTHVAAGVTDDTPVDELGFHLLAPATVLGEASSYNDRALLEALKEGNWNLHVRGKYDDPEGPKSLYGTSYDLKNVQVDNVQINPATGKPDLVRFRMKATDADEQGIEYAKDDVDSIGYIRINHEAWTLDAVWGPTELIASLGATQEEKIDSLLSAYDAAVKADNAPGVGKAQALYSLTAADRAALVKAAFKPGPGYVRRDWAQRAAEVMEVGDRLPVVSLDVEGRMVKHGTVVRREGLPVILVEHEPGADPADVDKDIDKVAEEWQKVAKGINPELVALQKGIAWLKGSNPADDHWAKVYNMPGFVSAATGGNGTTNLWGTKPNASTLAHEFGHNIDSGAPHTGESWKWLTGKAGSGDAILPTPPAGAADGAPEVGPSYLTARTFDQAHMKQLVAAALDMSIENGGFTPGQSGSLFTETRTGGHRILFDGEEVGPTAYGRTNEKEDYAESVRLYLSDRRFGKLGYLPPAAGQSVGTNLRFADLYPQRAKHLDTVFGNAPVGDTDWRKAQRARIADKVAAAGIDDDGEPKWGVDTLTLANQYAISFEDANTALLDGFDRLKAQQAAAKAAAEAQAAAEKAQKEATEAAAKAAADQAAQLTKDDLPKDVLHKIGKRKALLKYRAKQDKRKPVEGSGEGGTYVSDDLKIGLIKQGDTIEWTSVLDGATVRGTAVNTGFDADPYIVVENAERLFKGEWVPSQVERAYLPSMAPGSLKVGASPKTAVEAQQIADAYEADALAEAIADLAKQMGLDPSQVGAGLGKVSGPPAGAHAPTAPEWTNALRMKASKWIAQAGAAKHPNAKPYPGDTTAQAKANIAAELADRLDNPDDWAIFRGYRISMGTDNSADHHEAVAKGDPGAYDDVTPEQRRKILQAEVANRIGMWAGTSGDTNPWAVLMQRAVDAELGTGGDWDPHGTATNTNTYVVGGKTQAQVVAERWDHVGAFYRRFVRVQYEHTQDSLAEAGITEVSLYRGMHTSGPAGDYKKVGVHEVTLMPVNSWTVSATTAKQFAGAGVILSATIPASRILGSALTGFGCRNEHEIVVLNGPGDVTVRKANDTTIIT